MGSLILIAALCVGIVGAWVIGTMYLDIFTPEDVRAWRRLATMRGYAAPKSGLEKLAERAPVLQRLQAELDLSRLLGIAGRSESPLGFMARSAGLAFGVTAVALFLEVVFREASGDWILGFPPVILLGLFVILLLLNFSGLRREVRNRQEGANKALGDSLMLIAIMTEGRGIQLEDAVRILSRCVTTDALENIVDRRGFARLVTTPHKSTVELYRLIGEAYRIPMFQQLSDAAANTNVGFGERDMYTRLAKAIYQQRLAEAKVKGARAKILVTIPVAGMLIPLLVLLGAPAFSSLANSLR